MVLSENLWSELVGLGLLDGRETCALCRERPVILLDVARAPILLCAEHARTAAEQLLGDLAAAAPRPVVE